jgi:hypothetical protein
MDVDHLKSRPRYSELAIGCVIERRLIDPGTRETCFTASKTPVWVMLHARI